MKPCMRCRRRVLQQDDVELCKDCAAHIINSNTPVHNTVLGKGVAAQDVVEAVWAYGLNVDHSVAYNQITFPKGMEAMMRRD